MEANSRLPRNVRPDRYQLTLSPDLAEATFTGEETVELRVLEATSTVVLNALELDIHSARFTNEAGDELDPEVAVDEDGRMSLRAAKVLEPGEWALHLTFSGTLNDKLRGFYRSTFSANGAERVVATTQFEPTDARRAFPCWDEPECKAVFSVTLVVESSLTAVSNTTVAEEIDLGGGRRQVRFADTIPMSTYLLAFVVGPLELTAPIDVDGVALRVVHVPGKAALTSYALEVAEHALRFFTGWFGIPYPGDKLDLIALPDFAAGAMENLGAVTFRESLLLVDEGAASRAELERIADVISHETAHMWFGDLVTMSWWNGLWLNEAFATFMEMLCVDHFRPKWDRWVTFGRSRDAAMSTDGLSSTRPIEFPVARPEEAEGMFDILTYEKGAGVLRMLEQYLSTEQFRKGITLYLESHRYGNADTTDLWDAIEAATGEPVRSTMDSWIYQGGYPLVTVSLVPGEPAVRLEQEPFRYSERTTIGPAKTAARWQVPVLLRAGGASELETHRLLLGDGEARVSFGERPEWVVANSGGTGYYRVRYDPSLLSGITGALPRLGALERLNLVSDTWAATLAGTARLRDFTLLARLLGNDSDANVWSIVTGALAIIDRATRPTDRPRFESFVRSLLSPPFEAVGWQHRPGEPETVGTLRAMLFGALGTLGADDRVRTEAARLHTESLAGTSELDPEIAGAVVSVVASGGGAREFHAFVERYRKPRTPQEELRYLYALASFSDAELFRSVLEMSLGEVRTQNAPFLIGRAIANRDHGVMAWSFAKENWDSILSRFPDNTIPRMLEPAAALVDPVVADDVTSWCVSHPLRSGRRTVEQMLERLEVNVAFAEREGPVLSEVL